MDDICIIYMQEIVGLRTEPCRHSTKFHFIRMGTGKGFIQEWNIRSTVEWTFQNAHDVQVFQACLKTSLKLTGKK